VSLAASRSRFLDAEEAPPPLRGPPIISRGERLWVVAALGWIGLRGVRVCRIGAAV
jgi:hypothetical protein